MVIRLKESAVIIFLSLLFVLSSGIASVDSTMTLSEQKTVDFPVIMYHQLTRNSSRAGKYVLTVEQFENDLAYLKENGYCSVTLNQLFEFSEGTADLPAKPVMITFDDGCETLYEYAQPLLKKYGFTAVGFVVGEYADRYSDLNDHNLSYSCLDWEEISELDKSGIVDIQSHSYALHSNDGVRSGMKMKKSETLEQYNEFLSKDAAKMKEKMIEHSGEEPVALAYPFGSYSSKTDSILEKCGIKATFTCEEKVNIIKKAESEWLFGLGRYNRPEGIGSKSFFEKMGLA